MEGIKVQTRGNMILVVAELAGDTFHKISYELLGVARELAEKKRMIVGALVLGSKGVPAGELAYYGAHEIYYMEDDVFAFPEEYRYKSNIVPFLQELSPAVVLIGATNFGRSLAPRIAAALRTGLTADCTDFDFAEDGSLIQIRPAFSDNIFAHISTECRPQMATVRYKEFAAPERDDSLPVCLMRLAPYKVKDNHLPEILAWEGGAGEGISEAQIVVAAGRGVKNADDMKMVRDLAKILGAQVGVSRALVDAGFAGSECQIGYSGHRVKPKLYVACGISGAPQHIAGMKEAETIVAINRDPSAPIFSIADIACVGDIYEVIPQLTEYLKKRNFSLSANCRGEI